MVINFFFFFFTTSTSQVPHYRGMTDTQQYLISPGDKLQCFAITLDYSCLFCSVLQLKTNLSFLGLQLCITFEPQRYSAQSSKRPSLKVELYQSESLWQKYAEILFLIFVLIFYWMLSFTVIYCEMQISAIANLPLASHNQTSLTKAFVNTSHMLPKHTVILGPEEKRKASTQMPKNVTLGHVSSGVLTVSFQE